VSRLGQKTLEAKEIMTLDPPKDLGSQRSVGKASGSVSSRGRKVASYAGLVFGVFTLIAIITIVLHFGDMQAFYQRIRTANPFWLILAVAGQIATYACAAMVWSRVLARTSVHLRFTTLFRLALIELFANQAMPTGGISGSLMVMRGLSRRGVPGGIGFTATLIANMTYYIAYLIVGITAFILLRAKGDMGGPWPALLMAFLVCIIGLAALLAAMIVSRGRFIPESWRNRWFFSKLFLVMDKIRGDLLGDPRLAIEATSFQMGIFLLDVLTLWAAAHAVGMDIGVANVFVSFILASIVATLSPIPMGLGTFEGTCVGMMHFLGGGLEASLAATLIMRGLTLWLPMLPGLWLIRRETNIPDQTDRA
jgi:hypothetical protein